MLTRSHSPALGGLSHWHCWRWRSHRRFYALGPQLNRLSAMIISLAVFYSLLTDWGQMVDYRGGDHARNTSDHPAMGLLNFNGLVVAVLPSGREMDAPSKTLSIRYGSPTGSDANQQRRAVATQASQIGSAFGLGIGGIGSSAVITAAATPARAGAAMASAHYPSKSQPAHHGFCRLCGNLLSQFSSNT